MRTALIGRIQDMPFPGKTQIGASCGGLCAITHNGVACPSLEAGALRQVHGDDFCLVTPAEALAMGSDYLVIGRSITDAPDPMAALQSVPREPGVAAQHQMRPD
jgi:hypothetical protein